MDIKSIKKAMAGMFRTLYVLDSSGNPTQQHMTAYSEAPMSLAEPVLPAWIFFTGNANYPVPPDQTDGRLAKETRDFTACLYVMYTQAGIDGEAERRCEPYVDYARNLIQSHPLFYDGNPSDVVPGIMRAYLVRDDGITPLKYGNDSYIGLRFHIRVEGLNQVNYGNE